MIIKWQCRGHRPIEGIGLPLYDWLFFPAAEEAPHYVGAQINIVAPLTREDAADAPYFVTGGLYSFQVVEDGR